MKAMKNLAALVWFSTIWAVQHACPIADTQRDEEADSHVMPRDKQSGCLCRIYDRDNFITCYDTIYCVHYPKNIPITKPTLKLITTRIEVLNEGDLGSHTMLTTFHLEMNDFFYRIAPGAFDNMSNLINVSITYNKNLQYLEAEAFRGLVNVECLTLDKNGFHVLKDFTYSINPIILPHLQVLAITQMAFLEVVRDDFVMNSTSVKVFILRTCQIERIDPEALAMFQGLEVLDLGENNMDLVSLVEILKIALERGIQLRVLDLSEMGFKTLPLQVLDVVAQSNISTLVLNNNHFEIIEKFTEMPNLRRLELTKVLALNITTGAFDDLPNLRELKLDQNKFSEVPKAVISNDLEYLDLSYSENYFSLEAEGLANLTSLRYLNLSGNNILKIDRDTFRGLGHLQVLALRDCKIFYVGTDTFAPLRNLQTLDLRSNFFIQRGIHPNVFWGLSKLRTLLLGNSKLTNLSEPSDMFSSLGQLRYLGLEKNLLKGIPSKTLAPLKELRCLDLSGNLMVSWQNNMFTHNPKLHNLMLHNNQIKQITGIMAKELREIRKINFFNNPFICKCAETEHLRKLYNEREFLGFFEAFQSHFVRCSYPARWSNHSLMEYLLMEQRNGSCTFRQTVVNAIVFFTVFIFSGVLVFVILKYRHHIKYWLFLTKLSLIRSAKFRIRGGKGIEMVHEYDAFVSYSNEDHDFVVYLVKMLEQYEPYLKLCVYERDFEIGTVISETVLESVAKSRKTLLIVSEAFIKSQWCQWEVQVAENRRLFWDSDSDSLVIVKLSKINAKRLSPMLKFLMKTRIYLEWDSEPRKQSVFFAKLRNTLRKPSTDLG